MFIAKNEDLIILASQTREELEQQLQFMVYTSIEETDVEYELYNGEYLTVGEIAQRERNRLDMLNLTRGDVFIGLIQARMIDENTLKAQLERMPETTDEEKKQKMLALNALTNALNFHRGHNLVNLIGQQLGITPENLDAFFETKDYHYLELPEPEEVPEGTPEEEDTQEEVEE